jgi:hypothetical protein
MKIPFWKKNKHDANCCKAPKLTGKQRKILKDVCEKACYK